MTSKWWWTKKQRIADEVRERSRRQKEAEWVSPAAPQERHDYIVKMFPKRYLAHIDHDIVEMTLTDNEVQELRDSWLTRGEVRWIYGPTNSPIAMINCLEYRSIIIERKTEDGSSSVQFRELTPTDEAANKSGNRRNRQGDAQKEGRARPDKGNN